VRAFVLAASTPVEARASATGSRQVVKAAAVAARVEPAESAPSTVAAATEQPAGLSGVPYSSAHCWTIAENSSLGAQFSMPARWLARRPAYRSVQAAASLTSCSLPPGKVPQGAVGAPA
jgi:hypothetical protein